MKLTIFASAVLAPLIFALKDLGASPDAATRATGPGRRHVSPIGIGLATVAAIIVFVYPGPYISIALGIIRFVSIWPMRDIIPLR